MRKVRGMEVGLHMHECTCMLSMQGTHLWAAMRQLLHSKLLPFDQHPVHAQGTYASMPLVHAAEPERSMAQHSCRLQS